MVATDSEIEKMQYYDEEIYSKFNLTVMESLDSR